MGPCGCSGDAPYLLEPLVEILFVDLAFLTLRGIPGTAYLSRPQIEYGVPRFPSLILCLIHQPDVP